MIAKHNKKTIFVNWLGILILTSCSTSNKIVPSEIPRTPTISTPIPTSTFTPTVVPTVTASLTPTRSPYTQGGMYIDPYQDVRSYNLSTVNRSLGEWLIKTLWFDQSTTWSKEDTPIAENILKLGMNPGLGVRELHAEGITGKGVTVAIIDQNLVPNHPEFQGKIVKYFDIGTNQPAGEGSMHGPAVTSLLVGKSIGTAPDAKVYYVAAPSWLDDAQYYADALDWLIKENEKLPEESKIRVVSVSTMPSGIWVLLHKNSEAWDAAYKRAMDAGILVLDCTYEQGITSPCTYDLQDPDNVGKCIPNWTGPTDSPHKRIVIPTSRTSAVEVNGVLYQFTGDGGLSWTVPYLSGVLAMAWQINPKLTSAQLLEMIYASAYKTSGPADVINPRAFIDLVKDTIKK